MSNESENNTAIALGASQALHKLFEGLGSRDSPGGAVYTAYRKARKALEGKLQEQWYVFTILQTLRSEIEEIAGASFEEAILIGQKHAEEEIAAAGLSPVAPALIDTTGMIESVIAIVSAQIASVRVALRLPDSQKLILGDEGRLGILRPGSVLREITKWVTTLQTLVWESMINTALVRAGDMVPDPLTREPGPAAGAVGKWGRMAVSDHCPRVTDCCLKVDGQIVGMDEDFVLTGVPRFADRMRNPPFHYNCHTVVALVRR